MPPFHEVTEFILAVGVLISAVASITGVIIGYMNSRALGVVHTATNSMKDALVASTAKASLSEGVAKGRADLEKEQADRAGG